MKDHVRVAAISVESKPGLTQANLEAIRQWSIRAADEGAELVLLPELSLTGFIPNHPTGEHSQWMRDVLDCAWSTAETLDSNTIRELIRIADESKLAIAAGMLENAGNVLFNSLVLVGDGRVHARWRKMHIPMFEMQVYNGGGAPDVIDTCFGRIGANICFDALLPESTRLLGVEGCEIGLFPFAADPHPGTAEAWANWAGPVLRARCAENAIFGVACNYLGRVSYAGANQEFPGGAMIVGPDGRVIAETATQMLIADLRAESLRQARSAFEYTFRFRRPELYEPLVRPLHHRRTKEPA